MNIGGLWKSSTVCGPAHSLQPQLQHFDDQRFMQWSSQGLFVLIGIVRIELCEEGSRFGNALGYAGGGARATGDGSPALLFENLSDGYQD